MNPLEFNKGVIRLIECYKEAWELIKSDYWILFAISLVGILIGAFSMYIVLGAMMCGIFIAFFAKIDTGKVNFDDLWKGFGFFGQSLILILLIIVPTLIVYAIIYLPFVVAIIMGEKLSQEELMAIVIAGIGIDVIVILLMICFHTLLMFAFPLMVDRNLSAFQSIKLSMKAVWGNLGGIAGMMGLQFLAGIVLAMVTCGLGTYFAIPIMFGGMIVAYRKVFPSMNPVNFAPPTPDNFQNAGRYT
jgi:hypothetical protein